MSRGGKIQVGVIGAGKNTCEFHIPNLQAIADVAVVGVCNRTRASGDRAAAAMGIPQVYSDWREMIHDDALDAIVIGTWPYTHCEMTLCVDAKANALQMARRNHPTFERVTPPDEERGRWRVEAEFVGAIRGEEEIVLTTLEEGVRYMEFTEAVARSAETGRVVELPLGGPQATGLAGQASYTEGA